MNTLALQPINTLVSNAPTLVSDQLLLNCVFSTVHTLHKWWKWKQDAELFYTYYNRPGLALGDLGTHYLGKDNLIYAITAVALAVICTLWQTELARLRLVEHWREFKWQIIHFSYTPFDPCLLKPGIRTDLYRPILKTKIVCALLLKVLYDSFTLSMHLIDLYQYFTHKEQQERAKQRFVSNGAFLCEEFPRMMGYFQSPSELPFTHKLGVTPEYMTEILKYYERRKSDIHMVGRFMGDIATFST